MKKLLIMVPCISYGGLETVAITTAEALQDKYDITLLYFYPSQEEISTTVRKTCLNIPYSLHLLGQIKVMLQRHIAIARYKKEWQPDICYSIGKVASISNVLAKGRARCITSIHGYTDVPHGRISAMITKVLFGRADRTVCVSNALTQEFIMATGLTAQQVSFCANPFDIADLMQKSEETKGIPTLSGNPKLFAFGRLVPGKNFELALEAVHLLKEEYPALTLSIAGDGEHLAALQQMAADFDIADRVQFLGMLANPFAALRQADLLWNPSWNEGFGNTVVESMLCGVPVIATDCKVGPRENISPGSDVMQVATAPEFAEYGVLLPPSYPSDTPAMRSEKAAVLAEATRQLLENDTLRRNYAEKGRARAEMYALPHYIKTLTAILENE